MKAELWKNHEDTYAGLNVVCSDCGKELLTEDIGKKWDKCELCGGPICITCTHYVVAVHRNFWKDFTGVRRVCRKCVTKF